jgi:methylenetetrahydrofolate reductase (NADPH)
VKKHFPGLKVYTGLDPYRSSFREELDYAFRKLDAGSDGFYTQPSFSGNAGTLAGTVPNVNVWFGVAPVYSEKSRQYWEKINKVVFPPSFSYEKVEMRV